MFEQSCFIRKNSHYLQEKLKEMGYKTHSASVNNGCIATSSTHGSFVVINESRFDSTNPHVTWNNGNRIDCGTNEELFIAIASLRNDSDKYQWFICQEEYISSHTMELVKVGTWQMNTQYDKLTPNLKRLWRKASVKEIIEFFDNKLTQE